MKPNNNLNKMSLEQFITEFNIAVGSKYITKKVDEFNKSLIKRNIDVSFLKDIILEKQEYYRTYFQVSLAYRDSIADKFSFIDAHLAMLQDWWHVDEIMTFFGNKLSFNEAYDKATQYVKSELPFVRRLGYVIFIPRLLKDSNNIEKLLKLLKNDKEYYVVMGEAWLISCLAVVDSQKIFSYLKECNLDYDIVGKAIQKICDSYRISSEVKEQFKSLRLLKKNH